MCHSIQGQARTEGDCGPCQKAEQCSNHDMVNTSLSGIPPLRDKTSENTTGSYESRKLTVETKDAQINVKVCVIHSGLEYEYNGYLVFNDNQVH